jgi:hypothetical protein
MPLEIQQLLTAEDSPVAAVKKEDVPSFSEMARQGDKIALDSIEAQLREFIPGVEDVAVPARHVLHLLFGTLPVSL